MRFWLNSCGILHSCVFDLTRVVLAHAPFTLAPKNAPSKDLVCIISKTEQYNFLLYHRFHPQVWISNHQYHAKLCMWLFPKTHQARTWCNNAYSLQQIAGQIVYVKTIQYETVVVIPSVVILCSHFWIVFRHTIYKSFIIWRKCGGLADNGIKL